jgi:hypothetical protein
MLFVKGNLPFRKAMFPFIKGIWPIIKAMMLFIMGNSIIRKATRPIEKESPVLKMAKVRSAGGLCMKSESETGDT